MVKLLSATLVTGLLAFGAFASPFYNVTAPDGYNGWGPSTTTEDNEMEVKPPSDAVNYPLQKLEVEAFLWNTEDLKLVGGYDFQNGYNYAGTQITTGDIFVDLGKDKDYDLAIQFDFANEKYYVLQVTNTIPVTYDGGKNSFSSPFKAIGAAFYNSDGNNFGVLKYETNLSDAAVGFGLTGENHNQITMYGLDEFGIERSFGLHYTMLCGNDMIKGDVPEPTIISFIGLSLLGLAFSRRKNPK